MRRCVLVFLLILIITSMAGPTMFNEAKAERAVKFFESLKHTKGQFFGANFELLPWQKQIIRDVYGTEKDNGLRQYQTVYLEVPKKNGKSELAAGAALYHLYADGERNGEVYGCAADRQQASIVFDVAVDMIEQIPALAKRTRFNRSTHRITDKISGSFYQVLSAEAYTKHGLNVSAVIFDELHAQPSRELWDVMTFDAGVARLQPIWWIITTAGDDPDRVSVGWEQHDYATKILSGDVIDHTWYPVIYSYDGDDIYNEEHWHAANPSLGTTFTLEAVRDAAVKAKAKPADQRLFRWLRLNQWITTKLTTWLPLELFDQTVGTWERAEQDGKECYLGLDLSSTTDLTAACLLFPPQGSQLDWRAMWQAWIPEEGMRERIANDKVPYDIWSAQGWVTPTPGNVVDYNLVEAWILGAAERYKVLEVDADRAFAAMLLQRLETAGVTCVDIPQTYTVLTDPMNQVEVKLKAGELTHEANLTARWCFGNTSIAKQGSGLIKYVKEHKGKSVSRTKRIDLTAALVIAMARARFYKGGVDMSAAILNDDWGM